MCRFTNKKPSEAPQRGPSFRRNRWSEYDVTCEPPTAQRTAAPRAQTAQAFHVFALWHCRPVWSMYVSSFVSRILEIGTIS